MLETVATVIALLGAAVVVLVGWLMLRSDLRGIRGKDDDRASR